MGFSSRDGLCEGGNAGRGHRSGYIVDFIVWALFRLWIWCFASGWMNKALKDWMN
jgi:hypothetical protein